MRQPGKNNRQRGRTRRSGGGGQINRNTTIDSNGPDVRLRGNALQLQEKYTSLANDASASGERISAEAYFQYADHYFRVHSTIVAALEDRREKHVDQNQRDGGNNEQDGETKSHSATETNAPENGTSDDDSSDEAVAIEPVAKIISKNADTASA
ncbi:MAG: DUF4167 domain-containing protein [Candidatus Puniceispirillales bacterium WSBS_2018_MAG_OTU23]